MNKYRKDWYPKEVYLVPVIAQDNSVEKYVIVCTCYSKPDVFIINGCEFVKLEHGETFLRVLCEDKR